jgi:hypothetical protein
VKEGEAASTTDIGAGEATGEKKDGEEKDTTESERPRRATRKTVRISES